MIVKSILDTDLYKFTTSYAYMKLFPQARGTFEFFDRDLTEYPEDFVQKVYLELSNLGMLRLTNSELDYMTSNCRSKALEALHNDYKETCDKYRGGEEDEVEAIGWIPLDSIDKYQWAFDHDKIIREFAEWMHLEDGDLDMEDIDLDPV